MKHSYRLYSYFRSSSAYRVRIALHLKGIPFAYQPVHLLQDGGQQNHESYLARNPFGEVPTLEVLDEEGNTVAAIGQSFAILEYLEEQHPETPLLPTDAIDRARVRQIAQGINSSIQPIQNLRVMQQLCKQFDTDMTHARRWSAYWIDRGFRSIEQLISQNAGTYAFGDSVTFADLFLVPQHYNAKRFKLDMGPFPTIERVCNNANQLDAFHRAAPEQQPDMPENPTP